ncbi:hypothetical protein [Streptomyces sp. CMB-StM0423]|uniref:hypothetical protein n=1 Tax=Streptomyces sp. CMB-StM0423 TaxID=2059884 RepID=UPI0018FE7797|nr:hypothetical protein [Streptomyces sp. CMB-StM0423]
MSSADGHAAGLPVRMPRRQPGRHRKPERPSAPEGAPALVLAVPGAPSAEIRGMAEEVLSIARSDLPGLDGRVAYVEGENEEFPPLTAVLAHAAAQRAAHAEAGTLEVAEDVPVAVVVPLLAGPDPVLLDRLRDAIATSGTAVELTDVLGPHPLLAEALHVRLSEAGLARADRARLFTVATAADGIILGAVGGEEAVQAAGVTGMLLSARLAVPVMAAALDRPGGVAKVAESLRSSGSARLALAPYALGPELPAGMLAAAAEQAACEAAEPLGPYPSVGQLALTQYTTTLGIAPQPAGSPLR